MTDILTTPHSPALASRLRERFGSRYLDQHDRRYDSVRGVWNGMVDKRPVGVLRCADERDVAFVLQSAADHGMPVSVRGGGHQIAGAAVVADGLVIDLGAMRAVDVESSTGRVRVGGGALLGDLDRAAARAGVAVPAGVVSHTGVGGLTLGGGIGWLSRSRGLTCDSLESVVVVLASGEVVDVDAERHPDLFWALRGGGGNFGIVTEFVFRSAPIGDIAFGTRIIDLADAARALGELDSRLSDLPRELQVMVKLQRVEGDRVGTFHGDPALTVEWLWSGAPGVDPTSFLGLGALGRPGWGARRFLDVQYSQDSRYPHGARYYVKPGHLAGYGPAVIDAILEAAETMPAEDAQIECLLLGGAVADVAEQDAAFPKRQAAIAVNVSTGWYGEAGDADHLAWARQTWDAVIAGGPRSGYVNFAGGDAPDLSAIYGIDKLERLRAIKGRYDPDDVLKPAAHITPATGDRS